MQGDSVVVKPCQHFLVKGFCKFKDQCRYSHTATQVRAISTHPHPLGPDSANKRKKFFCDACGKKGARGYRCVAGCDFDVCPACLEEANPRELSSAELVALAING